MSSKAAFFFLVVFAWFVFGVAGWVLESIQESIVRRRFISKGFFYGPFVPCQGLGGVAVYFFASPFRDNPILVFFAGIAICTVVEYLTAVFLENVFRVKCWDYTTYPHTRFAQFQGRVCLTISLFFGFAALGIVYVAWDAIQVLAALLGDALPFVDAVLLALFLVDAIFSSLKVIRTLGKGKALKSWALFSETP